MENYINFALNAGFTSAVSVDTSLITCDSGIRALCSPEKCASYGSCWICPPGCGELDSCRERLALYSKMIVAVSRYEADMGSDYSEARRLAAEHNERLERLFEQMRRTAPDAMLLSTGGCRSCESCTYPDEPCRKPMVKRGSLSAFGINVGELCRRAGIDYSDFVPGVITFVGCILV